MPTKILHFENATNIFCDVFVGWSVIVVLHGHIHLFIFWKVSNKTCDYQNLFTKSQLTIVQLLKSEAATRDLLYDQKAKAALQ